MAGAKAGCMKHVYSVKYLNNGNRGDSDELLNDLVWRNSNQVFFIAKKYILSPESRDSWKKGNE